MSSVDQDHLKLLRCVRSRAFFACGHGQARLPAGCDTTEVVRAVGAREELKFTKSNFYFGKFVVAVALSLSRRARVGRARRATSISIVASSDACT